MDRHLLLDERIIDDVQNAIEQVSGLVDLLASVENFADPTAQLPTRP